MKKKKKYQQRNFKGNKTKGRKQVQLDKKNKKYEKIKGNRNLRIKLRKTK